MVCRLISVVEAPYIRLLTKNRAVAVEIADVAVAVAITGDNSGDRLRDAERATKRLAAKASSNPGVAVETGDVAVANGGDGLRNADAVAVAAVAARIADATARRQSRSPCPSSRRPC